jgi:AcrR family transcriptional regulator
MRAIAQREDIRDLILDGVDVLLARFGYKKMTMEDIAQTVGIGKGTIYLHFRSKEEVTLAHIDRIVDRALEEMNRIARSQFSAEQKIKKMLLARVLVRFDSVRSYSQSLNDLLASLRKPLLARRELHFEKEAHAFAAVLEEGKKLGVFHVRDVKNASEVLIMSTNALLPYSLTMEELGRRDQVEARIASIADLLIAGLTHAGGKTRARRMNQGARS